MDGYTVPFATLLISAGAVSDRLGARRVFGWGMVVFTAASAGCGAAPVLPVLLAARVVQGGAAAVMLPSSLALVRQAFADPAARARAVAAWSSGGAAAMAAGPVLDGILTSTTGWRAIFFVNLPVGAAVLVLANLLSARVAARWGHHVPVRAGLCAGTIGMLLLALLRGQTGTETALVPAGAGLGFALPSLTFLLLDALPAGQAGLAGGLFNAGRQTGGAPAVAAFGTLVSGSFLTGMHVSMLISGLPLSVSTVTVFAVFRPTRPPAVTQPA